MLVPRGWPPPMPQPCPLSLSLIRRYRKPMTKSTILSSAPVRWCCSHNRDNCQMHLSMLGTPLAVIAIFLVCSVQDITQLRSWTPRSFFPVISQVLSPSDAAYQNYPVSVLFFPRARTQATNGELSLVVGHLFGQGASADYFSTTRSIRPPRATRAFILSFVPARRAGEDSNIPTKNVQVSVSFFSRARTHAINGELCAGCLAFGQGASEQSPQRYQPLTPAFVRSRRRAL